MILSPPQTKGLPVPSSTVYSAAQPRPLTPNTPCGDPVSVRDFAVVAVTPCLLWKKKWKSAWIIILPRLSNKEGFDHRTLWRIEEEISSSPNFPESIKSH